MLDYLDKDLILMCKDKVVLTVNLSTNLFFITHRDLVPQEIDSSISKSVHLNNTPDKKYLERLTSIEKECTIAVKDWLINRTLYISQENAKWVYNHLSSNPVFDKDVKLTIALKCRAVSMQDDYWLKYNEEEINWKEIKANT